MFEQLIESKLAPLMDRLATLEEELESGARRGRNSIQLGTVVQVVGQRVVIAIATAAPSPWWAFRQTSSRSPLPTRTWSSAK